MQSSRDYPLIIAHRGGSSSAPENTIAAFEKAVDAGAEGIEFDVRLSKDGTPMVFHDPDLLRIAGSEDRVSDLTAAALGNTDAGSWFNIQNPGLAENRFAGESIPTLEKTLHFLRDFRGLIYIELKCGGGECEPLARAVCRLIRNSELSPRIIVKSFELDVIPIVKRYCPAAKTGALFALSMKTMIRKQNRLINTAGELGADYLSLHYSLASAKLVRSAKAAGLDVAVWTVNNPRWVKRCMKLGISHIITDVPKLLLAKRDQLIKKNSRSPADHL